MGSSQVPPHRLGWVRGVLSVRDNGHASPLRSWYGREPEYYADPLWDLGKEPSGQRQWPTERAWDTSELGAFKSKQVSMLRGRTHRRDGERVVAGGLDFLLSVTGSHWSVLSREAKGLASFLPLVCVSPHAQQTTEILSLFLMQLTKCWNCYFVSVICYVLFKTAMEKHKFLNESRNSPLHLLSELLDAEITV